MAADPTESVGALQRLGSETRFLKLFDDADALSIQGYLVDGSVVYWNRASEQIYGYTAEEALGSNLLDLIIPDEMRDFVRQGVTQMFESGQRIPAGRLNLKHKDGHLVAVYSSHTVVSVPGQPTVLFCMDTDMRELDRTEAELRIAATAFESQQGILITDAAGVVLRVNRALCDATGYSAEESVGQVPRLLTSDRQPPGFRDQVWRDLQEHDTWQGEVWDRRRTGEVYANWVTVHAVRAPEGTVTHYVWTQTDITQRKEAEAKILHLALYDPLTGLPNRRMLLERLQQAVAASLRHRWFGALLFIDLDHFKTLNDTLGHDLGDLLLQQAATRLAACIRTNDTAARFGGDEFVIMLEDLAPDLHEAAQRAEVVGGRILAFLNEPYQLREHEYVGSVSVGITLFAQAGGTAEDLMRQADLAMYEAKAAGRCALRFFDPVMQAAVTSRAELVRGLREGLQKEQFRVFYQPQVDRNGRLTGAEALVRWQRPGHGLVPPGEFIPVAEETGLIVALGSWVLETACNQLATWAAQLESAHLTMAVNVSANQFGRPEFVAQVVEVLHRTGANPHRLTLELTESLLLSNVDHVIKKMNELKAFGVGFALDDFGTGYSSLSYLRRLPLSQLKIDRSFVRELVSDPHSAAIARTIVVLSQTLGMGVMAEGVETECQRVELAALGCFAYQGFLFGRPEPIEQFQMRIG
jgi:diguanylate cyclase (GGDEF)-like protein/PAS domain S-box-containing protein